MYKRFFLIAFIAITPYVSGKTVGFPCKPSLPKINGQNCERCSLKTWAQKIFTLKERPVEFSSLPSKKDYEQNILTFSEFMSTLKECTRTIACQCKHDAQWLGKKSLYTIAPEIFTLDRPSILPVSDVKNFTFKPYVTRLNTKPGTICALFGDLHGSVHSLMRDLLKLQQLGYINNDFKITKKNASIIFFGDYIDRGIYGVEVMYTIARLKCANPDTVFLIRGNHEDYSLAPIFRKKHTKQEEKDNAPSLIDELYKKFTLTEKDEIAIFRFYEILPLALYLGCGMSDHDDYMLCTHGGLELGYNPHALLHANKQIKYELVDALWRKKYFDKRLSKGAQNAIKLAFDLDVLCGDIQDFTAPPAPIFSSTKNHDVYLGFMWNDFYVNPLKTVGQRGNVFSGWVYGQKLTNELLSWGNSKKVTLQGIFRAHQHNNETGGPMLNLLCCDKGITKVWKDSHLYTLLSAPDSKLEETGENCFTYDAFVLLTTAARFKDWHMIRYTQDTGMALKKWQAQKLSVNASNH